MTERYAARVARAGVAAAGVTSEPTPIKAMTAPVNDATIKRTGWRSDAVRTAHLPQSDPLRNT